MCMNLFALRTMNRAKGLFVNMLNFKAYKIMIIVKGSPASRITIGY